MRAMNDAFRDRKRRTRRWYFLWLGAGLFALIGIGGAIAMGGGETVIGKTEPTAQRSSPPPKNLAASAALAGASSSAPLGANDSDNDGLKDWEEEIYQTDLAKPDTDGDGTLDGDEVAADRDPLVAGPNDKAAANPEMYGSPEENITARILAGIQQSLTPEMIAGLKRGAVAPGALGGLSNALASIDPKSLVPAPNITRKDISVSGAQGREAVQAYFKAVAETILAEFNPLREGETAVFLKIKESGDLGNLNGLDPVITAYTNAIARIRAIPVPQGYESFAIEELSHLTRARDALQAIRMSGDDPIRIALLLAKRGRLDTAYRAFLERNSSELIARGIPFTAHDSGLGFIDENKRP